VQPAALPREALLLTLEGGRRNPHEAGEIMDRRYFLQVSAGLGYAAAFPLGALRAQGPAVGSPAVKPLTPPTEGPVPVAFLLSANAVVIDFAGPWEVFQDVSLAGRGSAFRLYTVGETDKPIRASAGMTIVPDFTLETAPPPKLVVIPAQSGGSPAMLEWIRQSSKRTDVTMSICTGALLLAKTGLFSGKAMTTHHGAYDVLATQHPDVTVVRGARFVDNGNLASSGGLTSGIDLAFHVVERYFGREVTEKVADRMEYQGLGWTDPQSNRAYAKPTVSK
jgi:transcriptional regulator GlxA family with amidase domain